MDSHHDEASVALPDSVAHLGRLEPGSIIDKAGLATLFHRCERSIDRAIERGPSAAITPPGKERGRQHVLGGVFHEDIVQGPLVVDRDRVVVRVPVRPPRHAAAPPPDVKNGEKSDLPKTYGISILGHPSSVFGATILRDSGF